MGFAIALPFGGEDGLIFVVAGIFNVGVKTHFGELI